jgi:flagellar hook-length control protein FliK
LDRSSAQTQAGEPFASVLAKAESASEPQKEPEAPKPARSAEEPAPRQSKAGQAGSPRDAERAEAAQTAAPRSEPQRALPGDKVRDNKSSADSGGTKPALNQASARPGQAAKSGAAGLAESGPAAKGEKKPAAEAPKEKQPSLSNKRPALELARGKAEKTDEKAASLGREDSKLRDKDKEKENNRGDRLLAGRLNQNPALALTPARQAEPAKAKPRGQLEPEAGEPGRAAADNKKKSAMPELKLTDLRSKATDKQKALAQAKPVEAAQASGEKAGSREAGQKNELSLDLGGNFALKPGTGGNEGADKSLAAAPAPHSFSEALAERLKGSWNNELVQSAHIVLKDGDAGTIRLHLKPESLGGVKIELKLADNSISGKIVVESDEAKSAFERNMASLNDAFKAGGFESAKLEVSVGSGGNNGGGQRDDGPEPFWSERRRLESFGRSVPESPTYSAAGRRPGAVDILA